MIKSDHDRIEPMSGKKAQGQVSEYHDFVIRNLVGIEGTSPSDVTARIIGYWIRDQQESLGKLGLSMEAWRRLPKEPVANVIDYGAKRASKQRKSDPEAP
jgi:hypothetical protein